MIGKTSQATEIQAVGINKIRLRGNDIDFMKEVDKTHQLTPVQASLRC